MSNSLTHKIFHADDRTMKQGKVSFKPLTMETVPEKAEENVVSKKDRDLYYRKNMSTENLHQPRTTEQNVML